MKPVILTPAQWRRISTELHEEHPKSVFMLRGRMKEKLGFTVREHSQWGAHIGTVITMHLDFFSERKRTMFLLKFSEQLATK